MNFSRHEKLKRTHGIWYENGKFHFSRETERRFFFILTLIVLGIGLVVKLGVF